MARERSDDTTKLRVLLDTSEEEYKLHESQVAGTQIEKEAALSSETHEMQKTIAFRTS